MFKRSMVLIYSLILIILILSGCSKRVYNGPSSFDELEEDLKSNKDRFVDGVEFGIGDSGDEVVEKYGKPISSDYLDGGLYIEYENIVFYTDGYINKDKTYFYGTIGAIDTKESYGVKAGMTIEESREILGSPDAMGIFDELKEYGHGVIEPKDFYYRGDYTLSILYDKDTKIISYVRLGTYREEPDIIGSGFLELTDWEMGIYESYILDLDDNKINGCTPINIMKIYLHAVKEKNYKAKLELYRKEENQLGLDIKIPDKDSSRNYNVLLPYLNPVDIEVDYDDDYNYVTISWEDKYLKEYDNSGNPLRFSFNLVRTKDRIWKVAFMPMEEKIIDLSINSEEEVVVGSEDVKRYYFEPNVSIIEGKLIKRMYYGPPNYGENPDTDAKQYPFILLLDDPIDVIALEDDIHNSDKLEVTKIQVVPKNKEEAELVEQYINKRIKIQGTFFEAIFGGHHTDVLIYVEKVLNQ